MAKRSAEIYPGQRRKEKRALFKRFVHPAIERLYKKRLFALFGHRCFKCGVPEREVQLIGHSPILVLDHHVPMALGGHLVPGNICSLCRACNERKLDRPAEAFYTREELDRLAPLLGQEEALLAFKFDWEAMNEDPAVYLLSVGVDPADVHEMMTNPDHPEHIPSREEREKLTIRLDGNELVRALLKSD